jgi:ribonucleoside-triphosphate reductase
MSLDALQSYVYVSKYARYQPDRGRRETFSESVDRVLSMHRVKYAGIDLSHELEFCRAAMKERLVLGSQRALQFGGDPILQKEARIYNCTTSYCDRPRFFQECLWLLLCGCGAGFSVQRHHVAKLPPLVRPEGMAEPYAVQDSIEGWADALGVLLASYGIAAPEFQHWSGQPVIFDYSQIRKKGAKLASSGGKAPGPEPLKNSLDKIDQLLKRTINSGHKRLRPIVAYDIMMHGSDAVLSGGVRRSATICLFSRDDEEMMNAKTGSWFIENPQRGRSNNSAVLLRDDTTRAEFMSIMKSVREFGEPGFVWSDSSEIMYNPCVEIGLYPQIDGESGWAFCNLCEINGKACKTVEDWERACTAAAYLGSMQAGYTSFPYLGEVSERIARRESLLGVSITGIMDNPDLLLNPELQRRMARHVAAVNEEFVPTLGLNPAARATCVKPAGTTSCILGTSSGIHPHHAKRYFRRAQGNELEAPLRYFEMLNPRHVEPSVWSANGTDKVVTFCIEVEDHALTKQVVGAVDLLRFVKLTQENWVEGGRNLARCAAPFLRHNVSNTINVKDDEWDDVADYIYENREAFAGVALLPHAGDRDYPQAPFVQVFTPEEIVANYGDGSLLASGLIVDALHAFDNNLWAACDSILGRGELLTPQALREKIERDTTDGMNQQWDMEGLTAKTPEGLLVAWLKHNVSNYEAKLDWIRRADRFATNYFGGDVRNMTYCMKDVNNWKQWCDLNREYHPVNWTYFREDEDMTENPSLDAACAGGTCDLLLFSAAGQQNAQPATPAPPSKLVPIPSKESKPASV